MNRYYLVKLETNAPDHKLDRVDVVFAQEVRLQFGKDVVIMQINAGAGKLCEENGRSIDASY